MKKVIIGLIIGIVLGLIGCLFIIQISSDIILEGKCSKPEFIYYLSQILGVFVTFMAVLVAIFGSEIKAMIFRPKCKIVLSNEEDGIIEKLNDSIGNQPIKANLYDCVLKVINIGNKEITNCELIISKIQYKTEERQKHFKDLLSGGYKKIYWYSRDEQSINLPAGENREVNLFRIYPSMQTPDERGDSPARLSFSGYPLDLKYCQKGVWEVTYKLQTIEKVLSSFNLQISWNGQWCDRLSEMKDEVTVKLKEIK